jgi:hypothetical protein
MGKCGYVENGVGLLGSIKGRALRVERWSLSLQANL